MDRRTAVSMSTRISSGKRVIARVCYGFALLSALGNTWCTAQDGKTVPVTPGSPYTLHVYADLVQVPSLVLNSLDESYRGLQTQNFSIRLDSGPAFHPRHLRLEGNDPITVALVLDASGTTANPLIGAADAAVSRLPLDLFGPQDHVSVFAYDCVLIQSTSDELAVHSTIQAGIAVALEASSLHGQGGHTRCGKRVNLWDAIGYVMKKIHGLPGRRVVLVLSEGVDHGSANSWETVSKYANAYSIAVFGLRPPHEPLLGGPLAVNQGRTLIRSEDPFGLLCGGTGGLSLVATRESLSPMMHRVFDMLRSRYILEFPRPSNGTAGRHEIDVSITDPTALIHTSGVTVPLQDKDLLRDPSTVPTDTSRAPVMGTRRISYAVGLLSRLLQARCGRFAR